MKLENLTNATLSLGYIEIRKQEHSALDALVVLNSANLLSLRYINSSTTPYNMYLGHTSASNPRINSPLLLAKYTKGNIRESTSTQAIQDIGPLAPVDAENNQFTVERLVEKRVRRVGRRKKVQYLVKWKEYPDSKNTWEDETDIHNDLIEAFEARKRLSVLE